MRNKKNRKVMDIITCIVLVAGIIMIVVSGSYIVKTLLEYHEGEVEYDSLKQKVFAEIEAGEETHPQSRTPQDQETQDPSEEPQEEAWEPLYAICDSVKELRKEYEDVVGWLHFDNMDISYPIMQGEDNDDYIYTTYSGESNSSGSIFLEAMNHADFQDQHTIIYGHNMKNGSMFGKLKKYRNDGFYEENRYFTIYTEDRVLRYEIFAYFDTAATSDVYDIYFETAEEYGELLNMIFRHSYLKSDATVNTANKIVTLSTCSSEGNRFVVNAVLIQEILV